MKRKIGELLPLELTILSVGAEILQSGIDQFYGYQLAKCLGQDSKTLIGYGTLYKALERLELRKALESSWEDPLIAARESRPRRRLYRLTALGAKLSNRAPVKRTKTNLGRTRPMPT